MAQDCAWPAHHMWRIRYLEPSGRGGTHRDGMNIWLCSEHYTRLLESADTEQSRLLEQYFYLTDESPVAPAPGDVRSG